MTVTERLMAPGQWAISLRNDTPISVRNKLVEFGHVVITSSWLDPYSMTDADLKGAARYTGIVRRSRWSTAGQYDLSGPGLAAWLGDENGKGRISGVFTTHSYTAGTLTTWVTALIAPMLSVGTIVNTATNVTWNAKWQTPRAALDYVCAVAGAEWRVNPDGTVDAGHVSTMWQVTPNDVIMRRAGAGNVALNGIEAGDLATERDSSTWTSWVVVFGQGDGTNIATGQANISSPYKDFLGNTAEVVGIVNAPSGLPTSAALIAAANDQLTRNNTVLPQLSITSEMYDVGRYVRPGDNVYVWDPDLGLVDPTATAVELREGTAQPMTLRCFAMTWAIERGMGVYYRDKNGAVTDLTDFVRWETTPTVWEVGQPSPTVFPVAEGVAATYSPAGERAARVWPPTTTEAQASAGLTLTTTPTLVTGTSATFTTTMPNAVAMVTGTFDFDASVLGFGVCVGELQLDGATVSGQAIYGPSATGRQTVSQTWRVPIAATGSHTLRLMASKTVAAGTAVANNIHTTLSFLILE